MKIIDEKGRLFGKINVIDFSVILFLLFLLPMFYFGYKMFLKKITPVPVVENRKFIEIEIYCKFIELKPEILKLIAVGDKEMDEKDRIISGVLWLGDSKPYQYKFNLGTDVIWIKDDPILKELPVRLKLKAEIKDKELFYNDQRITIGLPFKFTTHKYTLSAVPDIEIQRIDEKIEERLVLYVTLKKLSKDMAKLVSVGDKETDEKGEIIAEILSIDNIENNIQDIELDSWNVVTLKDETKKQVSVKMKLRGEIRGDRQFYFKDQRVIPNLWIEFKTDKYTVKGKIEGMASPAYKEMWRQVRIKFSGIFPELAGALAEGDMEKDSANKIIGRLRTIVSNKLSNVLALTLQENKFTTIVHPYQRDIIILFNLLCTDKDGTLYYKNQPVKIGNNITFSTDLYSISGMIIDLEGKQ